MITKLKCLFILCLALSVHGEPSWIFFSDKGYERGSRAEFEAVESAGKSFSERCIERRNLRGAGFDFADIPVFHEYIEQISQTGAELRVVSRLLNAVSVEADASILTMIAQMPFVSRIRPVSSFRRERPFETYEPSVPSYSNYGSSWTQNNMLGATKAHKIGLSGRGVLICITDTGFKLDHLAMAASEVVSAYDFIDNDSVVSFEPGDPDPSESHGTMTWSAIGGYYSGELVGTAYGASFLLARTENYSEEFPAEEDYWIAAAEWADSAGADIVSVSLGYSDWYSPDSMTGDIAPISIAADLLSQRGVCCVICSGNYGYEGPVSVTAPGDADSVITVGACDTYGNRLSFSGQGPTADGQIKPEVVALGTGVKSAGHSGVADFRSASGTSASTPLVAGLTALMLESRPELAPMDIRKALISTASQNELPDNQIGWGIPNVVSALSYPIAGRTAIPVFVGWNLVSLPLSSPVSADTAFPARIGEVWGWNPSAGEYFEADSIEPGYAYFVLYDIDTLLLVDGDPLYEVDLGLAPGWHAIGGVASTNSLASVIARSSARIHNGIFVFNKDINNYSLSNRLSPGQGGFILVTGAGSVRLAE